jgi:hypothetical protein
MSHRRQAKNGARRVAATVPALVEWLDLPDFITQERREATPLEIQGLIAHHDT